METAIEYAVKLIVLLVDELSGRGAEEALAKVQLRLADLAKYTSDARAAIQRGEAEDRAAEEAILR